MNKLIIMVGPSGSGKSTLAKSIADDNTVITSRDEIRSTLYKSDSTVYDYYKSPTLGRRENLVTVLQELIVSNSIRNGFSVILDNTNLKIRYIKPFLKLSDKYDIPVEICIMDTSFSDCIERDSKRDYPVGKDIISNQFLRFNNLKKDKTINKLTKFSQKN